ncbi:hypothetical protein DTL21_18625 [Bremerella cremea]|uniref:Uncharacterized protein n=1 Tax=Blastopirellula marina TaxID=124 RepID=A0A2S8FJZ1_9BACT|nr:MULTISPECIES: hypothetical protein [Pirellulaceae]PQO32244.1 hypothetical protein C5Y83_18610 [Blastopirellula marina]RCS45310.1 hypothetical protein DTL21_18625 [Bremerella cremea]
MTAAKQEKKKSRPAAPPEEPRTVPTFLPTSNPPKRNRVFLVAMIAIAVLWVVLLVYLALQQKGIA